MGVGQFLGKIYGKIEDVFYGLADFVDSKGIPVYSIIDPLEERGVPALPLSLALVLVLGFLGYAFFFTSFGETEITLSITNANGSKQLSGVQLEALNENGATVSLEGTLFSHGQKIILNSVGPGQTIIFRAQKTGYFSDEYSLDVTGKDDTVILTLQKDIQIINGMIKLVDPTGDNINDALIVANFADDTSGICSNLGNGVYECKELVEGEKVTLNISSSNYEDNPVRTEFFIGQEKQIILEPKPSAAVGKTNFIIRVQEEESRKQIPNVNIKIYDALDDGLLIDITDADGEYLSKINKGTSVRLVVSADEFVRYDSVADGIERTLRSDEELWTVLLSPGGVTVTVRIRDTDGLPQTGVEVQLFDSLGKRIDSKQTGLGGEVLFDDIDAEQTFFVTAFKPGYLPQRIELLPLVAKELDLSLQRVSQSNSETLQVFVISPKGLAANDATLNFFEIVGEKELPLGLPPQKSDITGKYSVSLSTGTEVLARAVKGNLLGDDQTLIQQGASNELFIELRKSASFVNLKLENALGAPINTGHVRIESSDGEVLFDSDLEGLLTEDLFFDPFENDFVQLTYVSPQNNSFDTQVYVDGLDEIIVVIEKNIATGFTPEIKFNGVYNISGKKVEGIKKGKDYYLHFEITFPQGNGKHGVHVRVGDDTIKYADSQDVGITGFSAVASNPFFGRTYSPFPAPGLEGVDFSNTGKAGNHNKFIELYFEEAGTKIVKVRVQAKETATDQSFDVHYRAWSEFGSAVNRNPLDNILANDEFNSQKSGLYAKTNFENIRIFETTSNCKEEICTSYRFLNKDNSEVSVENFKPIANEIYALEITINPLVELDATIKATTSRTDPKLFFQGYAVDGATVFPDNNKTNTSLEINGILSPSAKAVKVLIFFKTVDTDTTSITLQTINSDTVLSDNFFFEIFREKHLFVTTKPSQIVFGENFDFLVKEDDGTPVENATITLSDSFGKHLETIVGVNIKDRGKNGIYEVQNTFDTGILSYTVQSPEFRPKDGQIEISMENILRLPQTVEMTIIGGQPEVQTLIDLENLSDQAVEGFSFEIQKLGNYPNELTLSADSLAFVGANSTEKLTLKANYNGGDDSDHGEAILIVRARALGQFNVSAQTKVIIDYNPTLPQSCLEFSKTGLVVFLESGRDTRAFQDNFYNNSYYNQSLGGFNGSQGFYNNRNYDNLGGGYDYSRINSNLGIRGNDSFYNSSRNFNDYDYSYYGYDQGTARYANQFQNPSNRYYGYNNAKQVEFVIKNKCDVELELTPEIVARNTGLDDGIRVEVNNVTLKPAGTVQSGKRLDEKRVSVSVTNTLLRNYPSMNGSNFDIFFNSPAISKSLSLNVLIWDPAFGLEVGRNIELWLAQENPSFPARAQSPIFVRNVGQAPIENLDFRQTSGGQSRGNVNVRIEPALQVRFLGVGQSLLPPKTIVAEAARTEKTTPIDTKIISVRGVIDGRVRDFGPIYVTTHVSGFECLSIVPNNIEFVSKKTTGTISKTLNVKNSCSEEVRLTQVNPEQFGSNTLTLSSPNQLIAPGTQTEIELTLNKNFPWEQQTVVTIDAFLVRSAKFTQTNPINVDIKLGETAVATKLAVEEKNVLVCQSGKKEKIRFPKIATTPNCETAYCDAELMAEFLVAKASEKLKEAKRQVSNYKSDIINTSCNEQARSGYCDFDRLQVGNETFTVFLQNDSLTPELFKKIANKTSSGIGNFTVDYISGNNVGGSIGQIGNRILLNGTMAGCGMYRVSVGGAVGVVGSRLDPKLINILIDFFPLDEQENISELTEQCLPKVQNIMNFLPQDKSFKGEDDDGQTWLGFVQTKENSLKNLSKQVAKGLFNHEERFVDFAEGSNFLEIGFGAPSDYIVKVEVGRDSTEGPRKFIALVQETGFRANASGKEFDSIELQGSDPEQPSANQNPGAPAPPTTPPSDPPIAPPANNNPPAPEPKPTPTTSDEKLRVQMEREAAKAIAGLKKNAIDGCISENDDFFLLKSAVEISGIEIELSACTDQVSGKKGTLTLIPGSNSCCSVNVSSPLSEKVIPNFISTDIPGIEGTNIFHNANSKNSIEDIAKLISNQKNAISGSQEIELLNKNARGDKFSEELLLCTNADEHDFLLANGKTITLEAKSAKNSERKATSRQVNLAVCGVHPNKLIDKIIALKEPKTKSEETYYATLAWQGGPESIQFRDISLGPEARARLAGAKALDAGGSLSGQTGIEAQKRTKRIEGLGIYLLACGATSVFSSWKFGFGWFTDGIFNCVIPAAIAGSDLFDSTKSMKEFVVKTVKDIPVLSNIAEFIGEQAQKAAKLLEDDPENLEQTELDELAVGALISVPGYTGARVIQGFMPINSFNTAGVAGTIADDLSRTIVKEQFRKITSPKLPILGTGIARLLPFDRENLRLAIKDSYSANIKSALGNYTNQGLSYNSIPQSGQKTVLQLAVEEAHASVAKDPIVLDSFSKMKNSLVNPGTKNALTQAEEAFGKQFRNIDGLKASASQTVESLPIEKTTTGNIDLKNLKAQRKVLADNFIADNLDNYRTHLDEVYGKDFLQTKSGSKTYQQILETDWQKGVKSYVKKVGTTEKIIPLRNTVEKVYSIEFDAAKAKRTMEAAVNQAKNNKIIKPKINDLISRRGVQQIFGNTALNADDLITKQGGKYKIKYSKFKALLTMPFTKTFWKNMAKGAFTGVVSNAVGLWAYKGFMDKYGGIEGADVKISQVTINNKDTDGDGIPDASEKEISKDRLMIKYKTYPIQVKFDGKKKEVFIHPEIDPQTIPDDAPRIQECNNTLLNKYNEIPNIRPDAKVFQKKKLADTNIKAVVNYYEKYGRILKDVVKKDSVVPEALLVTVAVWHTGLGAKTEEWIAGCDIGSKETMDPAQNFRCASQKLGQYLSECSNNVKCTLQKYHDDPKNTHYDKPIDFDELVKTFEVWNSEEFKLSGSFSLG